MRLFLSRFAKTASLLMMLVALLLSLSVNVFSAASFYSNGLGFFQVDVSDPSVPVYRRCGNATGSVVVGDYNMGQKCWYGSRVHFPLDDIPIDREFVQLTFYISLSAVNSINPDYFENFFGDIKYFDFESGLGYQNDYFPLSGLVDLKPIKTSSSVTSRSATLNVMLTKDQLIKMGQVNGGTNSKYYRLFIFPQINSNFMISQLQATSNIGFVQLNVIQWTDTTDLIPVDEQILRSLSQMQTSIDNGFTTVVLEQGKTNEKLDQVNDNLDHANDKLDSLDSAINGNYVDPSDMAGIDSSIGDHSAAEGEVQNALNNILDMDIIDSDGNSIDISLDGPYFQNLQNTFNFDLSGSAVSSSAGIFRKTLTGYIGLFGSFIFFPLVLGILGALLGRPSGA